MVTDFISFTDLCTEIINCYLIHIYTLVFLVQVSSKFGTFLCFLIFVLCAFSIFILQ